MDQMFFSASSFSRVEPVGQFWPAIQLLFNSFSIFSSGGQFVQQSSTFCTMFYKEPYEKHLGDIILSLASRSGDVLL